MVRAAGVCELLHEDLKIRKFLKERLYHAGISKVEIERAANKAKINIYTARPGIVIGKKGAEIEKLKSELGKLTPKETFINIHEVRRPDLDAQLVAENVALQLERRVAFRRAMKEAVAAPCAWARRACACSRPGVWAAPRSRARSGIAKAACRCTRCAPTSATASPRRRRRYGVIGVKVWIFRGEVLTRQEEQQKPAIGVRLGPHHAPTEESQISQAAEGPPRRHGVARRDARVRRLRPAGHRPRLDDGARARSRPRRAHPPHQARRPRLDPRVPGQAADARSRPRPAWARARARPRCGWRSSSRAA